MIYYDVATHNLNAHIWRVKLNLNINKQSDNYIYLPNWTPGSYMIRDYTRHIISISAFCDDKPILLQQVDKNTWQLPNYQGKQWQFIYDVYAFDLSVRGSFLDNERGFFESASLLITIKNLEDKPCILNLNIPQNWQIACALTQLTPQSFYAKNYAELIDAPVEIGQLLELSFLANDIPHKVIISGHYPDFDQAQLLGDIKKICETHINLFGHAPFEHYLFLLHVSDDAYGGLEHRNSTALLASRKCLPKAIHSSKNEEYIGLLGLFSHEYFHAWNIKSIKPQVFIPYNLQQETYTEQLWAFEGITSYYDDLALFRSGCITIQQYLQLIAKNITQLHQQCGRFKQTVAQSSFNAWTKYYKQDENAPNAISSYYQKGALIALCLDLYIRQNSSYSLDDVMCGLYQEYQETLLGIAEKDWQKKAASICHLDLSTYIERLIYTTTELPLEELLLYFGIELRWINHHDTELIVTEFPESEQKLTFGAKLKSTTHGLEIKQIHNNSHAEIATLAVGDVIIAINQYHFSQFEEIWAILRIGQQVNIHYFRHGILYQTIFYIEDKQEKKAFLCINDEQHCREKWLS